MRKLLSALVLGAVALLSAPPVMAGPDLDRIKARGQLICGVQAAVPGFAATDARGGWSGFNVDFCRAVAVTIFGDPTKVQFTAVSTQSRFPALRDGQVDILSNNTTWTMSRDGGAMRFAFPAILFFDGQAMMVNRRLNVTSARDLRQGRVCIQPATTVEQSLADFFAITGARMEFVKFESLDELRRAYDTGRCDVFSTDFAALASQRTLLALPSEHIILPERLSKEPLAPVIRDGDDDLRNIVAWTAYALIEAEELGITRDRIAELRGTRNPILRRFLGVDGEIGAAIGAPNDFAARIVAAVGNYGEIYERHLGMATPLRLERGLNNIWFRGGLLYAPPVR